MANKGLMALGAGILGLGAILLFRKKAEAAPPVPEDSVGVMLRNPPSEATKWQISVMDWDITQILSWGTQEQDNIGELATFEIPAGWAFPLRIIISIYQKLNDTSRQLYSVQSYKPFKPFTVDEPDPDYKEVFIPDYGSYYYNVSKEKFEK